MISAEIIADSKNEFGNRITSFVLIFPRIVLAEFNTHRMLSRNSASSRAIPFRTMVNLANADPFIPIAWQKDHSGMQGSEYFTDEAMIGNLRLLWLEARDYAVRQAILLNQAGVTKQVCNRLLEPFMYHKVIATGTEWENFFALRAHPQAEIHIAKLADLMLQAMNKSEPKQLKVGEWHIPFGDRFATGPLMRLMPQAGAASLEWHRETLQELKVKIATARCARVSYNNFEGNDDYAADIKLHDRLAGMGHWSPFEHCARAMDGYEYGTHIRGLVEPNEAESYGIDPNGQGWSGNFRGFIQYRKTFANENKTEVRLINKAR